jgi:two-component system, chemotaxis family, chemotaxis protein CheY
MEISTSQVKDRSVVLADDDDVTRQLLGGVLRAAGLRVVGEAADGARALEMFTRLKPEIVCLDIEMPEMSGLDVLAKIREANTAAIVLMITGATSGENVRSAIAGHADGIIAKPFNTAKVIGEMERALARSISARKS